MHGRCPHPCLYPPDSWPLLTFCPALGEGMHRYIMWSLVTLSFPPWPKPVLHWESQHSRSEATGPGKGDIRGCPSFQREAQPTQNKTHSSFPCCFTWRTFPSSELRSLSELCTHSSESLLSVLSHVPTEMREIACLFCYHVPPTHCLAHNRCSINVGLMN